MKKSLLIASGLALLAKEDEPTLIVLTDAVNLDAAGYYAVAQQALVVVLAAATKI